MWVVAPLSPRAPLSPGHSPRRDRSNSTNVRMIPDGALGENRPEGRVDAGCPAACGREGRAGKVESREEDGGLPAVRRVFQLVGRRVRPTGWPGMRGAGGPWTVRLETERTEGCWWVLLGVSCAGLVPQKFQQFRVSQNPNSSRLAVGPHDRMMEMTISPAQDVGLACNGCRDAAVVGWIVRNNLGDGFVGEFPCDSHSLEVGEVLVDAGVGEAVQGANPFVPKNSAQFGENLTRQHQHMRVFCGFEKQGTRWTRVGCRRPSQNIGIQQDPHQGVRGRTCSSASSMAASASAAERPGCWPRLSIDSNVVSSR